MRVRLKYCPQQRPCETLAGFHLAEGRDKEREHAQEHHYKSIYTLYLITNGFGEEF